MITIKNTGTVFRIPLKFERGFYYGELIDYTHLESFTGLLLRVFKFFSKGTEIDSKIDLVKIRNSGELLYPMVINKIPSTRGKGAWSIVGKLDQTDLSPDMIHFKDLRGMLHKNYDWSQLSPWFLTTPFVEKSQYIPLDYESLRHLETNVMNHPFNVADKLTMLNIILSNEEVTEYYDLTDQGNINMYVELVNTSFPKALVKKLISVIPSVKK